MHTYQHVLIYIALFCATGLCGSCSDLQVSSKTYTTEDATVLAQIAYVSEFTVQCNPASASPSNLYALLGDNVVPVAEIGPNKYQVSWTEELKTAQTGNIGIKVYDEEGYSQLRKALRSGDGTETVKDYFTIYVNHPGSYKGPCLSCESLAAVISALVAYYAIHLRMKFVS